MRKYLSASLLLVTTLAVSPAALAEWYFGAKTGPMLIGGSTFDDTTNTSVYAGYQIGMVVGDLGVEAEVTRTSDQGVAPLSAGDVEVEATAVYAAFRTAGPLYLKAKGGFANGDILLNGTSVDDDFGSAYGVGLGIGLGILQIELEYTTLHSDINFLSLGIQF